jgi:PAS domain S-box-containing protein
MQRLLNKFFKTLYCLNATLEFSRPSLRFSLVKLIAIFFCLTTSSTLLAASETDGRLDSVTLQLKWKHQFQFAGYYAALEKGFYRQAGLDVKIIEAKEGEESTEMVLNNDAEFGTAMSDLVLHRAKGRPVVVLASIFQHSPYIILVPKITGIQNIHKLSGKRIALEPHSEELVAYLKYEGIPLGKMVVSAHPYDTSPLIKGDIDAMSAYSTDEPFMLLKKGIEYSAFSARSGGIDFYGDTLFTTEKQVLEHPERVSAFLKASIAGWEYALSHSKEIIDLILSKYSRRHSREHLVFEAQNTKRLIMADVVGIGYMNPGRWKHIADTYVKLGMADKGYSLEGFIYDPNRKTDFRRLYISLAVVILIAVVVFLVAAHFYKLNQSLKMEMQEHHLVRETLKKEKDTAQKYLDIAGVIFVALNAEGEVTVINRKGCDVLGYDVKEVIGNNWFDHFIPESMRAEIKDVFLKLISGEIETSEHFENPVLTKSGRERIVEWHNSLLTDQAGQIIGTLSSGTDITERKQFEEALRESEEKYRNLVERANDGVLIIQNGKVQFSNTRLADMLGCTVEEMIHTPFLDYVFPDDRSRTKEINEGRLQGEDVPDIYEITALHKDGKRIDIEANAGLIAYHGEPATLGFIRDITGRKQTEEALRQSERNLKIRDKINSIFLTYPDEKMYEKVLKVILKIMGSEFGTFGYFDEDGSFVTPAVTRKIYWEKCNVPEKEIILEKGTFSGIWGRAIKERKTLISNDGPFNTPKGHLPIENTMVTPIIFRDAVISAIHLANKPNGYDQEDQAMLGTIADQIAPVLYARLQRDKQDEERRQVEEALRESEELHRITLSNISDAVFITDNTGDFTYICPNVDIIFGYSLEEVSAFGNIDKLLGINFFDRNELESSKEIKNRECKIQDKSGVAHVLLVNVKPVSIKGGTVLYTCRDITEHKQAEEALQKSHDELEWHVKERTAELTKANQQLLFQMAEQETAEEKLRQAERRYRTIADFTYDWEWWTSLDGTMKYISPSCERISGYSVQDFMEDPSLFREIVIPEDRGIWDQHVCDSKEAFVLSEVQFRIKNKDGKIRWIEHACRPVSDHQGNSTSIRASNRDITIRKQTESTLQASRKKSEVLASKLLSAQESERARLARELHDDISQRLAFLNIEVDKLEMKNKSLPEPVGKTLRQIARDIGEISSDIHSISRRLHPTTLGVLGLVRSIEFECKNFTRLKEIPVTLDLDDGIQHLSKEISLCTYRILQEGLRNILRHAEATGVHVTLSKNNDIMHLLIKDNGIGFDRDSNTGKTGLGFASMTERARLVRGDISIESRPGKGTAIKLAVPLASRNEV